MAGKKTEDIAEQMLKRKEEQLASAEKAAQVKAKKPALAERDTPPPLDAPTPQYILPEHKPASVAKDANKPLTPNPVSAAPNVASAVEAKATSKAKANDAKEKFNSAVNKIDEGIKSKKPKKLIKGVIEGAKAIPKVINTQGKLAAKKVTNGVKENVKEFKEWAGSPEVQNSKVVKGAKERVNNIIDKSAQLVQNMDAKIHPKIYPIKKAVGEIVTKQIKESKAKEAPPIPSKPAKTEFKPVSQEKSYPPLPPTPQPSKPMPDYPPPAPPQQKIQKDLKIAAKLIGTKMVEALAIAAEKVGDKMKTVSHKISDKTNGRSMS